MIRIKSNFISQVILGISLLFLSAKLKIPFYPVAFTLHTLMCGVNYLLFSNKASITAHFTYIALGIIGFPIFTHGSGIGASFGYISGLGLASFILTLNFANIITRYIVGLVITYLIGGLYLSYLGYPNIEIITMNFMPSEIVKLAAFIAFCKITNNKL